jgi:hypothetical protein
MVKEPSHDWDQERQSYLNRLYDGSKVDCIEQLRVRRVRLRVYAKFYMRKVGWFRQNKSLLKKQLQCFYIYLLTT